MHARSKQSKEVPALKCIASILDGAHKYLLKQFGITCTHIPALQMYAPTLGQGQSHDIINLKKLSTVQKIVSVTYF